MGKPIGQSNVESILNSYNYGKPACLKKALRQLLRLEQRAFKGNEAAMILITDLKDSIGLYNNGHRILTARQKEVVILCLVNDLPEKKVAEILGVKQQSIQAILDSAIDRIRKYLQGETIQLPKFSEDDTLQIIALYNAGYKAKGIAETLHKELRATQNKIKNLKRRGLLPYDQET